MFVLVVMVVLICCGDGRSVVVMVVLICGDGRSVVLIVVKNRDVVSYFI